MFDLKETQFWS